MPSTSIICGVLLILIGLIGYGNAMASGNASFTALIPAVFGIVIAGLGLVAKAKDGLRKHMMHVAVIFALLGFFATAGRLISKLGELTMSPAVIAQASMAIVCLVFVVLAIRSFAAARRQE